jgi:hypothetical protein
MEIIKAEKLDNIIRETNIKDKLYKKFDDPELHRLSRYDCVLYHLGLGDLPTKESFNEEELFYSRYYWFHQFKKRYFMLYGPDGSLDEQSVTMWEHYYLGHSDIDWKLLEQIENDII